MCVRNNLLTVLYMFCIMADFKQSHWFCPSSCNPEISISNSVPHWNTYFCLFVCFCFVCFFSLSTNMLAGTHMDVCFHTTCPSSSCYTCFMAMQPSFSQVCWLGRTWMYVCLHTTCLSSSCYLLHGYAAKFLWNLSDSFQEILNKIKIKTCLHRVRF